MEKILYTDLSEQDQQLVHKAREATFRAYAPYSHFYVGSAVLMDDGKVYTGSNQENASFPLCLCAEKLAILYAKSQNPDQAVAAVAIVARNPKKDLKEPVAPCGACRQIIVETEHRQKEGILILLAADSEYVYRIQGSEELLPLQFEGSVLGG